MSIENRGQAESIAAGAKESTDSLKGQIGSAKETFSNVIGALQAVHEWAVEQAEHWGGTGLDANMAGLLQAAADQAELVVGVTMETLECLNQLDGAAFILGNEIQNLQERLQALA